jgi:uncharacterized protein
VDGAVTETLPRRPFLGVGVREEHGRVLVTRVLPGSMAAAAQIEGDAIVAIDGETVSSIDELAARVRARADRAHIAISVFRNGLRFDLEVPVVRMPAESIEGVEVRYGFVRSRGVRLRTIFTTPRGIERPPAILFLQGISCRSVDFAGPFGGDPIAQMIRVFGEAGFATMRVEKPGLGDSEGGPCGEIDFFAEVDAFDAALRALASMDVDRIFLFGHSLGGMIAPLIAGDRAHAVVAYGSSAARWTATLRDAIERQLPLRGARAPEVAKKLEAFDADPFAHRSGRSLAFHLDLDAVDFEAKWRALEVPVLVAIGSFDWVTGIEAQKKLASVCKNASVLEIEGLDHSFERHASLEASMRDTGKGEPDVRLAVESARWMRSIL